MTCARHTHNTPASEIVIWQSDDALAKIDICLEGGHGVAFAGAALHAL